MPCNLAVSITKAAVKEQKLQELLIPDIVKTLLESYIANRTDLNQPTPQATIRRQNGEVTLYITQLGSFLTVQNGNVSSRVRGNVSEMQALIEEVSTLLQQASLRLFDQKIAATLKRLGTVTTKSVEVNTQGQKTQATMFTLDM